MLVAKEISLAFGVREIVNDVSFTLQGTERTALLGDNGAGKSTLMKILMQQLPPDGGTVTISKNKSVGILGQEPDLDLEKTPRELAASGLDRQKAFIAEHAELCENAGEGGDAFMKKLEELTTAIEAGGGFDVEHRVDEVISRLNVPQKNEPAKVLSGGERRRLDLARVLLSNPDVLLLDEPTNHLDRGAIKYLAELLKKRNGPLLFTSHDRAFVDDVATGLLELDSGDLYTHPPSYEDFIERRLERKMVQGRTLDRRKRLLAREVAWAKTSPKARSTKQTARLDRAAQLVEEVTASVKKQRAKVLEVKTAGSARLAKTILELKDAAVAVGEGDEKRVLIEDLNLILVEGERWGIVGDNGAGKTTLLKAILGQHPLHEGEIKMGGKTKITVFDQHKADLDYNARLDEVLAEGDYVQKGDEHIHVCTYLEQFLFDPADRGRKVETLSGGERNRLWLARLFREDANCMMLDEPTNDLDIETLSVLEDVLIDHPGVALIVSHDKQFLNRVCTGILAVRDRKVTVIQGDYTQYETWLARQEAAAHDAPSSEEKAPLVVAAPAVKKKKRSYKEQQEYATIEERVAKTEAECEALEAQLQDPKVASDSAKLTELSTSLGEKRALLETLFERWQQLEELG